MGLSKFNILYADPPWRFKRWSREEHVGKDPQKARRTRRTPYPCLSTDALCKLPVFDLCAQDCCLFLWAIYPMLPDAFRVIEAWGFTFKTVAFTWTKLNPGGVGFHFGLGYWSRSNPEICLLATKGRPKRVSASIPNLVISPRREHSRKPDEVRERIVALCGDRPRAELFARQKTPGWAAWGDEIDNDFTLPEPSANSRALPRVA